MLNNRKSYAFDFDSNLVFTQDTVFLLKQNGESWHKVELSQQEFDQLDVDGINRRWLDDDPRKSLENFTKAGNYKKALLEALNNDMNGPARGSFLVANESASPIAMITARGQSPQELKESHEEVIYGIFNLRERERLVESMEKRLNKTLLKDDAIELYLNSNLYLPVESQEFFDMSGTSLEMPTKIRKHIAFDIFLRHVNALFTTYYGKKFIENPQFSMGFSDDNINNSQSMIQFIKSDLLSKYPKVKFVVYNTHDFQNVKKIIVK